MNPRSMSLETNHSISVAHLGQYSLHWHTMEVRIRVGGILDTSGMIADFSAIKAPFRGFLNTFLDHATLVTSGSPLAETLQKESLRVYEIDSQTWIQNIALALFAPIRDILPEGTHLVSVGLRVNPDHGHEWVVENKNKPLIITGNSLGRERQLKPLMDEYECVLNFGHRLASHEGLCKNIHGHTWRVKVKFSSPLPKTKHREVTSALDILLKNSWDHLLVLDKEDDLGWRLSEKKQNIKSLKTPPTSEYIAIEMRKQIEQALRKEWSGIKISALQLIETPTNIVNN